MKATPKWLNRCASDWLKRAQTRRSRSIKPPILEQLEDRAFPGTGMLMLDLALTRTQSDAPQTEQANAAATRRPALGSHESSSNSGQQRPSDTARARPLELATSSSPSGTVSPALSLAVVLKDKSGETSSRAVSPNQRPSARLNSAQPILPKQGPPSSSSPHGVPATNPAKGSNPPSQASAYRPINEVGNNVANPTLGTAGTDLLRVSPAAYCRR